MITDRSAQGVYRGGFGLAKRAAMACVATFACAVAPAYAADDPLLSGYSGPGGGEQVVIGSSVLPKKNGNGSIRSSAAAPTPPAHAPAEQAQSDGGPSDAAPPREQQPAAAEPSEAQTRPVVAAKPSYPNTISSASSVPLSRRDFALVAVAAFAVALIAFAAARLRRDAA